MYRQQAQQRSLNFRQLAPRLKSNLCTRSKSLRASQSVSETVPHANNRSV